MQRMHSYWVHEIKTRNYFLFYMRFFASPRKCFRNWKKRSAQWCYFLHFTSSLRISDLEFFSRSSRTDRNVLICSSFIYVISDDCLGFFFIIIFIKINRTKQYIFWYQWKQSTNSISQLKVTCLSIFYKVLFCVVNLRNWS